MSATWVEPPPPQGMGCCAKGCLILVAFFLLLGAAFAGGTFLAVRFLRTSYFATESVPLPATSATEQEQQTALTKWKDFEGASETSAGKRIELSADELNALIAAKPELRGKAFVTIENDSARLQVSFPLTHSRWLRGRYMNAECTVQSAPGGDPAQARIASIVVNGKAVAEDISNWRGPWGFRRYIDQWTDKGDIKTFEIKDGKVILEKRGSEQKSDE